ncbi:isoprenylcysteine carboxylmethyltransferase family protein [Stenotrophomonas pavanii]|uniref:methyltransferase family protein n=1 Tax=Stenotrophomonas pavanii TaxID=487698 RepID=UPI002E797196|nr:isoprenylcysteine carboxylmethyltransferase family protein [Stenotrophomonas pavanii]
MTWLETRIPPPLVMLACAMAGLAASAWGSPWTWPMAFPVLVPAAVAATGLALNLLPKLAFRRAGTTVNPLRPQAASALVTHGVYRHTRNPMYLGQALVLLGAMLYLQDLRALLAVPLFVVYITRLQILPEERMLSARFPDAYAAFCRRVRRWL